MLIFKLNLLLLLLLGLSCLAHAGSEDEYRVKAAFIYNFARFVEWPPQLRQLNLCVLGQNPFEGAAEDLRGKTIDQKPLVVKAVTRPISDCQMLFIAHSENAQLNVILHELKRKPVLTVSDTSGFGGRGVMFNFFLDAQQRVRFEVNQDAIRDAGLTVSSKLLKLGRQVEMVEAQ